MHGKVTPSLKYYKQIGNELIEKNISKAIDDWHKYPWNKNIPKNIFLNYLLPYKIFDENPEDWRSYFYEKYKDSLNKHINNYVLDTSNFYNKDPNELYYQIIVNETGNWFVYNAEYPRLCNAPSFNELMCLRQGDCLRTAYLNTYILRAMGMPCAIDIVPWWGSRNGWHANEVFWDGKNRMRTPSDRSFDRPAKVFRLSFKQQNTWKDSIQPFIGKDSFLLPNLQHNHWQDVTGEHTATKDITYHLPDTLKNIQYAYICVCNYGEWKLIFWGKVDITNTAKFRNMGCQILYQVALPHNNTYELTGNIFMVDSCGNTSYRLPNFSIKQNMVVSKINTGALSYVKKDEKYCLYMLTANNKWQVLQTQDCKKDSTITITNMPSNAFYKLSKVNASQNLERIFTYKGGKQIWW